MAVCLEYQTIVVDDHVDAPPLSLQLAAIVCLVLALSAKVWIQHECTDLGYRLAKEREKTLAIDFQRRELELQLSVLTRSEVLEAEAARRLGLKGRMPGQIVEVR